MRKMNPAHYNAYTDEEFMRYADQDHPKVVELCRRLAMKIDEIREIEADELGAMLAEGL